MDLGLAGKTVLVTGASKGIGAACAEAFAAEGCNVVLAARDHATLSQVAGAIRSRHQCDAKIHAGDLSTDSARLALAAAHPDIDILVNNAGAIPAADLPGITMDRWRAAWDLKVLGYVHLTQLYLEHMRARSSGVIVNIIGGAGRSPRWDYVCGAAGNAALMAFTGAVGGRSPDFGVRVMGINPSSTRTERTVTQSRQRAQMKFGDPERWEEMLRDLPLGRLAEAGEIARTAVFLASPACGYVSGATIDVDGGSAFRR